MLSWFRQLDNAHSATEVIAVARDYLATWLPEEIALLPKTCRPARMKTEGDIESLHVCLVEEYRQNRLAGDELAALQRLTSFIVRASVRMAQLQADRREAEGGDGGEPPGPSAWRAAAERER